MSTAIQSSRQTLDTLPQSERQPDWNSFYRNGYPTEVIVISDDDDDEIVAPPAEPEYQIASSLYPRRPHNDSTSSTSSTGSAVSALSQPSLSSQSSQATSTYTDAKRLRTKYVDDPANEVVILDDDDDYTLSPYSTELSLMADSTGSLGGSLTSGSMVLDLPESSSSSSSSTNIKKKRKRLSSSSRVRNKAPAPSYVAASDPLLIDTAYLPPKQPIRKPLDISVPTVRDTQLPAEACDDDDGHFVVKPNTPFANRYHVSRLLGQGTFGKVVAAYDRKTKSHCAIKIIRAVDKYREASRIELRVLTALAAYDKSNAYQCIHLRECFDYRNHICIVTDLLGISIYDFMKSNDFMPFPGSQIQAFAAQMFKSVAFLHDLSLVHTDLKPENILLTSSDALTLPYRKARSVKKRNVLRSTAINLIDFGSAIFNDEHHSSVVSTRHYRAPEIILGTGWSFPCDIWSIGCILVELCTGEPLFQTHDNLEHLALMERVIGSKFPEKLLQQSWLATGRAEFIDKQSWTVCYPKHNVTAASIKYVNSIKPFHKIIQSSVPYAKDRTFWTLFQDLLTQIFVYEPRKRISARDALRHPFFSATIADDGTTAAASA